MPVLHADALETDPSGAALLRRCLSEDQAYRARAALADPRIPRVPRPVRVLRPAPRGRMTVLSCAGRPGW